MVYWVNVSESSGASSHGLSKIKGHQTAVLYTYGSDCWAISKTDTHKIDALDQWCLCMLLGIKWYQFVRNDDVRRLTKQPKLTAIIQSRRLTSFGHIMCMDDNADAKRILLASPPADWKRQPGRPRITWLGTVQQDLKQHHLTLREAADLAQNHPIYIYIYIHTLMGLQMLGCFHRRTNRLTTDIAMKKESTKAAKLISTQTSFEISIISDSTPCTR